MIGPPKGQTKCNLRGVPWNTRVLLAPASPMYVINITLRVTSSGTNGPMQYVAHYKQTRLKNVGIEPEVRLPALREQAARRLGGRDTVQPNGTPRSLLPLCSSTAATTTLSVNPATTRTRTSMRCASGSGGCLQAHCSPLQSAALSPRISPLSRPCPAAPWFPPRRCARRTVCR
jgi:hypothetical protein